MALVVYLTVAAIGVKREPEEHLGQSLGLVFAIVAAFALPHLFTFVNLAPVNAVASTVGSSCASQAWLSWCGVDSIWEQIGARRGPDPGKPTQNLQASSPGFFVRLAGP
jgi:hypothetical protein